MSRSHWIKGGTTDEAFQDQGFLWERGASVCADFFFFMSFEIFHMHKDPSYVKQWVMGRKQKRKASYVSFRSQSVSGARGDTDRALRGLCSTELRTLYYSVM